MVYKSGDKNVYTNYRPIYLDIKCGVPQRSILGPILFILYINDICDCSKILNFTLFADDTNSFHTGSNIIELCKIVTEELEKAKYGLT